MTQARTQKTQEKILKAAKSEFTKYGFKGASIEKIAQKCAINHSLIYHHFKNKKELWVATKQYITEQAKKKSVILPSLSLDWPTFLKELLSNSYHFYKSNPDIIKMIYWQSMESSNLDIGVTQSKNFKAWEQSILHYQNNNEISDIIPIEHIIFFITSITSSLATHPAFFLKSKKNINAYLENCFQLIDNHLSKKKKKKQKPNKASIINV